ncbi:acetyl-CoA carboxylase biotin carboxyl carrier protein [Herbihabitans rhizosphaerae]|uniref:Biotin carboxyl carrier protein of acetyl-CoA carboxylase n=1 Tax=Herbihabitans rhizosphaerae TaxID=1872711 RepID=A0A4Q7KD87_9PSEU|nr:acetyl-CoA carboxylase biotin carboxyl carrier protein [Herbihabitans rhizosphaerae]RZS31174.1 acetyl-CoA carboxylase biotin carboxyl carrier protein [Herbihabitans rhizosphaerae]
MSEDDLLRTLSEEARRLAADVAGPLSRVQVRVGTTAVEMEWRPPEPAVAPVSTVDPPEPESSDDTDTTVVRSPMVGTFYHAPAPGEPPFVSVGETVTPDTVIGIVEAMKLLNRITAETTGVVRDVLVPNGDGVEFDQPLLTLEPLRDQESVDR